MVIALGSLPETSCLLNSIASLDAVEDTKALWDAPLETTKPSSWAQLSLNVDVLFKS